VQALLLSPLAFSFGSLGMPRYRSAGQGRGCRPEPPFLSPRAYFFVAPSASEGSPPGDTVPNEMRDATLSLGRTKKDAWQDKVEGDFFKQPLSPFDFAYGLK
jgi:hypothetical protein